MKIETTISLDPELMNELNRLLAANGHSSLSEFIEGMLRSFLAKEKQATDDFNELNVINQNADRLNQEADDALTYQMEL